VISNGPASRDTLNQPQVEHAPPLDNALAGHQHLQLGVVVRRPQMLDPATHAATNTRSAPPSPPDAFFTVAHIRHDATA
jgi:hypothetical protein